MAKRALQHLNPSAMEAVAQRFRALGEVSRLRIVQSLQDGEKNVTDIVDATQLSQPNVSRHLAVLVGAGLIAKRKDGLSSRYRIVDESLGEICAIVCKSIMNR